MAGDFEIANGFQTVRNVVEKLPFKCFSVQPLEDNLSQLQKNNVVQSFNPLPRAVRILPPCAIRAQEQYASPHPFYW